MKKTGLILLTFLLSYNAFSQCQRVFLIDNMVKLKAMHEYRKRVAIYYVISKGKGIYKINRFVDSEKRENWLISFVIDDTYRDNLPDAYAFYADDIIIIYNESFSHPGSPYKKNPFDHKTWECFQKIIQDRVYIRPPVQDKYFEFDGLEGRPLVRDSTGAFIKKPVPNKGLMTGGGTYAWVIFEKDMSNFTIAPMY